MEGIFSSSVRVASWTVLFPFFLWSFWSGCGGPAVPPGPEPNNGPLSPQALSAHHTLSLNKKLYLACLPALLPAGGPVSSGYGWRLHPVLRKIRMHAGIDIAVPVGTPVVAPGLGVVRAVTTSESYGLFVEVVHGPTGYVSRFAHLSSVPEQVYPGAAVWRGAVVGYSGESGLSTGPHLHYEVRDASGRTADPAQVFRLYSRIAGRMLPR